MTGDGGSKMTGDGRIRDYRVGDEPGVYYVCLKTGDFGADGENVYEDDPDALGRIYAGPYLEFERELALILEDVGKGGGKGEVVGYALGAFDSRRFYERYEHEWRPKLCQEFPDPAGDPASWTRVEAAHHLYHHPDYTCPEPYDKYPSHLHIDLLPQCQGQGLGRRMIQELLDRLRRRGSPGVHLGMSAVNDRAFGFYESIGFKELCREGEGEDGSIYMGLRFQK